MPINETVCLKSSDNRTVFLPAPYFFTGLLSDGIPVRKQTAA